MITCEAWVPVVGYEDLYHISDLGRVKRVARAMGAQVGKILRQQFNKRNGYYQIVLTKRSVQDTYYVHRLAAQSFIRKMDDGEDVNHKDGNKKNNRLENLEITSRSKNIIHSLELGLSVSGERSPLSKLKADQVRMIRKIIDSNAISRGGVTRQDLASYYGVCFEIVSRIGNRRGWKYLEESEVNHDEYERVLSGIRVAKEAESRLLSYSLES